MTRERNKNRRNQTVKSKERILRRNIKKVTKTKSFSGKDQFEVLKDIEKWRYDNGYIIRSSLDPVNFTFSMGED